MHEKGTLHEQDHPPTQSALLGQPQISTITFLEGSSDRRVSAQGGFEGTGGKTSYRQATSVVSRPAETVLKSSLPAIQQF
jgi:hypothetical protein